VRIIKELRHEISLKNVKIVTVLWIITALAVDAALWLILPKDIFGDALFQCSYSSPSLDINKLDRSVLFGSRLGQ